MPSVLASVQDDLYDWLNREAPDYLRALASGADPREVFLDYLRGADAGAWFAGLWSPGAAGSHAKRYRGATGGVWLEYGFRAGTGRQLAVDTVENLRRYFAERSSGAVRLCWLSKDPGDDTPRPIGATQLQALLDALPPHTNSGTLAVTLRPLLQGLALGVLPFENRGHRVVVVTPEPEDRASEDQAEPDPPAAPKEEISPARHPSMREAITQLIDEGHRPGRSGNMQWLPFRRRVIELCGVREGELGYSLDRIQEVAREILRKRAK
jgi:hypothetical protein